MAERATLVDTTISFVPIYTMCCIKMHVTNLNSIDSSKTWSMERFGYSRKRQTDGSLEQGHNTQDKGGLSLKNLRLMNEAFAQVVH
jgi:hypothetical protein